MVQSKHGVGPIVEAAGLTKVFRDFWMRTRATAVDGIDFTIEPGVIFGMLGPNGRIVEAGRNGVRQFDVARLVL